MKKIDLKSIKVKGLEKEEIEKNKIEARRNTIVLYVIPISITIFGAIMYFFTLNILYLIIFAIALFITLFGWDYNSRICDKCGKWNSLIWIDSKRVLKTTYKTKKNLLGKEQEKKECKKIERRTGKCKNCGNTIEKEYGKFF